MKKHLLLPCLLLMLAMTTAFGQLSLIPKVGATYSTFSLSDDMLDGADKPGYKMGFVLGAAFEVAVNDRLAIQPELLFVQKGVKEEISEDGYEENTAMTLNYLEVPVLVKLKFGNFHINAGPSIAFGLGGKYDYEVSYMGPGDSFKTDGDIKFGDGDDDDVIYVDHGVDFGLQVGGGVKAGPIVIDLRYGMGLTNINDEPDGFSGDWKVRNSSFQVTVGYPIPLGAK